MLPPAFLLPSTNPQFPIFQFRRLVPPPLITRLPFSSPPRPFDQYRAICHPFTPFDSFTPSAKTFPSSPFTLPAIFNPIPPSSTPTSNRLRHRCSLSHQFPPIGNWASPEVQSAQNHSSAEVERTLAFVVLFPLQIISWRLSDQFKLVSSFSLQRMDHFV